jgi:hypothetical protein
LHIEEAELVWLPTEVHRFRNMLLSDEVARQAAEVLRA